MTEPENINTNTNNRKQSSFTKVHIYKSHNAIENHTKNTILLITKRHPALVLGDAFRLGWSLTSGSDRDYVTTNRYHHFWGHISVHTSDDKVTHRILPSTVLLLLDCSDEPPFPISAAN